MKVLATGAGGQLGSAIVEEFAHDHEVAAMERGRLDITRQSDVLTVIDAIRPDVIINCAAFTNVDRAEDEPAQAFQVNALAVRSLARAAALSGATLVHYGTDFVFSGSEDRLYTEGDPPNPCSVYGASKLVGEWFAQDTPRHFVLRVESLFGGPKADSSLDRIVNAILDGREARVFVDRTVSPSYVADVARATRQLLERKAPAGLYHCVNSGSTTWAELAEEAARRLDRPARLVRIRFREAGLRAARPQYSALSNGKLAAAGIRMPDWRDALGRYLATRTAVGSG